MSATRNSRLILLQICTFIFVSLLSGCGGGGGGGGPSGATAQLPTLKIPAITQTSLTPIYGGTTISFSAATDANPNINVTYSWDFGDGSAPLTGTAVQHSYANPGSYNFRLAISAPGYQSASAGYTINVNPFAPPFAPLITIGNNAAVVSQTAVQFSAFSADPANLPVAYQWDFGDGSPSGSGPAVTHTYPATGVYMLKVTATNSARLSNQTAMTINVISGLPGTPTIVSSAATASPNQVIQFTGSALSPLGRALNFDWRFGDGSSASGASVSHAYSSTGSYQVSLVVTDSAGKSSSSSMTQTVLTSSSQSLVSDCSGSNCGALNGSTYSGNGVGIWRYNNVSNTAASINVAISGVRTGQAATLIYTNGSTTATYLPSNGNGGAPVSPLQLHQRVLSADDLMQLHFDQQHARLLERNRALRTQLHRSVPRLQQGNTASGNPAAPSPTPAVGALKSWNDLYVSDSTPVKYDTKAVAVCQVNNGRNVVFWLDTDLAAKLLVSDQAINAMTRTVCGSGGFSQLKTLLGDLWGNAASAYSSDLIQDAPNALQDINIVIVNNPASQNWAGYFYGYNNFAANSSRPNSNQALLFFISASQVKNNLNYALSTLLHEATHMTNFYQREIARNTSHETWLEETSAMMTEDVVAPGLLGGYNTVADSRLPGYQVAGGAVSYINWPNLSGPNYSLGGSFGAFLNRRYGLSVYQQLIGVCKDGQVSNDSYLCLDSLIRNNGGTGFADEFARFGTSVFARLPPLAAPQGYGFPLKTDGAYQFSALDPSLFMTTYPMPINGAYAATSHFYSSDTISGSTYRRTGIIVPAGTSLSLVIR